MLGIDADRDMSSVVGGVMTRFSNDEADKVATQALHAAKGVTNVYFEGDYPVMVMKSGADQPDAPKGKFLTSVSYREPEFYRVDNQELEEALTDNTPPHPQEIGRASCRERGCQYV